LVDGDGGVDSTALAEESSHSSARALRGNEDNVDVLGHIDLSLVLEDGGETVGEVESLCQLAGIVAGNASHYLSLGDLRLDSGPGLRLGSVTEQVHDDGTLGDGLIDIEEVLSWNPAILLGVLP
jgi:hypothetical protein